MKISAIEIDGFGVWSGLSLDDLSEQLTVFYGPNEAGKTTVMQLVRSVMFGFSAERRARYLPPLHGGRPGGALKLVHADEPLTLARHADDGGEAHLVDRHGSRQSGAQLRALTGVVDETVFNNVFVCGLHEIQTLGTLTDSDAARLLYDASLGTDVSLSEVLTGLSDARRRLLSDDERPAEIQQLWQWRARLVQQLDQLRRESVRYVNLLAERAGLTRDVEHLEAESRDLDARLGRLAIGRGLEEKWNERAALDRQLAALGPLAPLPDGAMERLAQLRARLAAWRRRRKKLLQRRAELQLQIDQTPVNETLCRQEARLEALAEQQPWIASLADQVRRLSDDVAALELEIESHERLGGAASSSPRLPAGGGSTPPKSQSNPLPRGPISPDHLPRLAVAGKALRRARALVLAASDDASAGAASGETERRIQAALARHGQATLQQALDRAGQTAALLRRRIQLDERIDQLQRRRRESAAEGGPELADQQLSGRALVALGVLFSGGFAAIAGGLLLPAAVVGASAWPWLLSGTAGMAAAVVTKSHLERSSAERWDQSRQQGRQAGDQLRQCEQERDELDAELPRGGGPLVARLQAAERDLAELEELLPLQAKLDSAQRRDRQAAQSRQQRDAELAQAQQRWQQSLRNAGLPTGLEPDQVRDLARARHGWSEKQQQLAALREELSRRRQEYETVAARVVQLAQLAGLNVSPGDPLAQLAGLLQQLRAEQERRRRREQLLAQSATVRRRQRRYRRFARRLVARRRRLFRLAGTHDEDELRRRADAAAQAQRLGRLRAALADEIDAALAAGALDDPLRQRLESGQGLDSLSSEVAVARERVAGSLKELYERRGQLSQRIEALAADRRLAQAQLELDDVERRLRQAIGRWRSLGVCQLTLEAVRDLYERDRQPEALREASGYLARLTGGRYPRVWTPLGDHVLRLSDAQNRDVPIESLSRGTREQLFLALRLALVSAYERQGVRLPLVLDDVLVNFDEQRARAAAGALRDFARAGRQVLFFTCHEHVARMFKSLKVDVRRLPEYGAASAPAAPVEEPPVELEAVAVAAPEPAAVLLDEPPAARPRRRFHAAHGPKPRAPRVEPRPEPEPVAVVFEPVAAPAVEPVLPPVIESIVRSAPQVIVETMVLPPAEPILPLAPPEPPRRVVEVVAAPPPPVPRVIAPTVRPAAQPVVVRVVQSAPTEPRRSAPVPAPAPPRAEPPRRWRLVEESPWDAEEFAGELTDRVARSVAAEPSRAAPGAHRSPADPSDGRAIG